MPHRCRPRRSRSPQCLHLQERKVVRLVLGGDGAAARPERKRVERLSQAGVAFPRPGSRPSAHHQRGDIVVDICDAIGSPCLVSSLISVVRHILADLRGPSQWSRPADPDGLWTPNVMLSEGVLHRRGDGVGASAGLVVEGRAVYVGGTPGRAREAELKDLEAGTSHPDEGSVSSARLAERSSVEPSPRLTLHAFV
jgi:hypothetical protein